MPLTPVTYVIIAALAILAMPFIMLIPPKQEGVSMPSLNDLLHKLIFWIPNWNEKRLVNRELRKIAELQERIREGRTYYKDHGA